MKECVCEALEITMSNNNGEIDNKHFTQIQGATIGGPDSASVTDIFGGRFIDTVARNWGPFEPRDWRRYRDNTWDIEWGENAKVERLEEFTQYLNINVLQGRILFSVGLQIRRNCPDRVQGDQYFTDNLVEYKRHLLKCRYASENIDRKFLKAAKIKREKPIAPEKQKPLETSSREYYFVTDFNPEFLNIRKYLEKHRHT